MENRKLSIMTASSCKSAKWKNVTLTWSEFVKELTFKELGVTMAQFKAAENKSDIKDNKAFVGGKYKGGTRKRETALGQDLLCLDLDNLNAKTFKESLLNIRRLGSAYIVHSTISHTPMQPKIRVIIPTERTITPNEYQPLAREVGRCVGLDGVDPTCFRVNQLMYYPTVLKDAERFYEVREGPALDVDRVLRKYGGGNAWADHTLWPKLEKEKSLGFGLGGLVGGKQSDPREKKGMVGAVCRVYNMYSGLEKYFSEEYLPTEDVNLYDMVGGSGIPGLRIYDDGLFAYSHHGTDPCCNRLVNFFDLVRLWRFGHLDTLYERNADGSVDDWDGECEGSKSFKATCKFFEKDELVMAEYKRALTEERFEAMTGGGGGGRSKEETLELLDSLGYSKKGIILKTLDNAKKILHNDPLLIGLIRYDEFSNRLRIVGAMPWDENDRKPAPRIWDDEEDAGLTWYLEKTYGYKSLIDTKMAMKMLVKNTRYNSLGEYLEGLVWDGVPRMETVFVDYLGAEDTPYVRDVTMKWFVGSVRRAIIPGYQFELIPVLSGKQGDGKTKLVVGLGKAYALEGFCNIRGTAAIEKLEGKWIVELGEMTAVHNSKPEDFNQFVTTTSDYRRVPYDIHPQDFPRRCTFIGTTNQMEYLRDYTGGRRFAPLTLGVQPLTKSYKNVGEEVDQLWAEAMHYHRKGVKSYMDSDDPLWDTYKAAQEYSRQDNMLESLIIEFINIKIPKDWYINYPLVERLSYYRGGGETSEEVELVERTKICKQEIWFECLEGSKDRIPKGKEQEINAILSNLDGWERNPNSLHFGYIGRAKGYIRV